MHVHVGHKCQFVILWLIDWLIENKLKCSIILLLGVQACRKPRAAKQSMATIFWLGQTVAFTQQQMEIMCACSLWGGGTKKWHTFDIAGPRLQRNCQASSLLYARHTPYAMSRYAMITKPCSALLRSAIISCLMAYLMSSCAGEESSMVLSQRAPNPYFWHNFLYRFKVHSNECPPWSELCECTHGVQEAQLQVICISEVRNFV